VLIAAAFLAPPVAQAHPASARALVDYGALDVLHAPSFWIMYLMFLLGALGGLMAIAQLAPIAKEYQVANTPVWILDLTLPALAFALAIDRVFSGLSKPFFGWIADRVGREETLCLAFALEAGAIVALSLYGRDPLAFVLLAGVIFLGWGQIYSLFPALCADTFGSARAGTHAGLLFTAKGVAALIALQFSALLLPTVEWHPAFYGAALLNALAAVLAIVVLKPLRARSS
jgi:OFA family oxalate/formate antiporter-like MFS transporter